jgi:hypothetical protein
MTVRVDTESHDANEEPRLGAIENAPLPADRQSVIEEGKRTKQHGERG